MDRRSWIAVGFSGALVALFALGGNVGAATATHAELSPARDLRADAVRPGKQPRLVVILFSLPDCSYCDAIRREQLLPLARDRSQADRLVVREVSITGSGTLLDFGGRATTEAGFAHAAQAKFSPTVAFFDPSGRQTVAAIVGARLPDFYGAYLDEAIRTGIMKIREPAR